MKSRSLKHAADEDSAFELDERQTLLAKLQKSSFWRLETALILGATLVGLGSAALSEANRTAAQDDLLARYKVATVLVAAKNLPAGTKIEPETVRYAEVLQQQVTPNSVDQDGLKTVVGRSLAIDLREGDPVLLTAVEGAVSGSTVATKVPPGKRLVTLAIKDAVAKKGWIQPNDHVDIIAAMDLPSRGHTTFTLLEDITLVSVGKASVWSQGQALEGTEIGFYATPKDVEFINYAEKNGEFSLSLRNPRDVATDSSKKSLGSDGMDMNKFLDHAAINKASGGGDLPVYVQGQREVADPSKRKR